MTTAQHTTIPMLSSVWTREKVAGWWLSEKLDGVRALFDGERLFSRDGKEFSAPAWFLAQLGTIPLDGELWAGRGAFSTANGACRSHRDELWAKICFCAFDVPRLDLPVEARLTLLQRQPSASNKRIVPHRRLENMRDFRETLRALYHVGAEGFVLRAPESLYVAGRSASWLKVRCANNMGLILSV